MTRCAQNINIQQRQSVKLNHIGDTSFLARECKRMQFITICYTGRAFHLARYLKRYVNHNLGEEAGLACYCTVK